MSRAAQALLLDFVGRGGGGGQNQTLYGSTELKEFVRRYRSRIIKHCTGVHENYKPLDGSYRVIRLCIGDKAPAPFL